MNNFNKPTKFSVTSYGRTTTVEVDHSDVDMEEFLDIMKVLAIGMTFHEDTWKRSIIELGAQYEEEMKDEEEDVYQPDPSLVKAVDDYLANISDKDLDEAFAQHNADEEADWDVTLNDGLEEDGWNDAIEKQYWENEGNEHMPPELEAQFWNEQPPEPFATPEEVEKYNIDGEFDDYGKRIEKVVKKKKKDAKRK